jgi:hypothetical protein
MLDGERDYSEQNADRPTHWKTLHSRRRDQIAVAVALAIALPFTDRLPMYLEGTTISNLMPGTVIRVASYLPLSITFWFLFKRSNILATPLTLAGVKMVIARYKFHIFALMICAILTEIVVSLYLPVGGR